MRANQGLLRQLLTQCHVSPAFEHAKTPVDGRPQHARFRAIWDTGATASVITAQVVDACQLKPTGMTQVSTANGLRTTPTYLVNIGLPNGVVVENVNVSTAELGAGAEVLIGMDIITLGDFSLSNVNGLTVFSFRTPSLREVDFVKELNQGGRHATPQQTPGQSFFGRPGKRR